MDQEPLPPPVSIEKSEHHIVQVRRNVRNGLEITNLCRIYPREWNSVDVGRARAFVSYFIIWMHRTAAAQLSWTQTSSYEIVRCRSAGFRKVQEWRHSSKFVSTVMRANRQICVCETPSADVLATPCHTCLSYLLHVYITSWYCYYVKAQLL